MSLNLIVVLCSRSSSYFAVVLRPFLCVFLWYSLSMLVAVLNDWYMEVNGFDFPLYLSISHMIVIFLGSYIFKHTNWYTRIYFGTGLYVDDDTELQEVYRGFSSWRRCVVMVGSMSLLMAAAVALRYLALDYMDITAVEVISSSSVLVVLIVSVFTNQEKVGVLSVLSVLLIVGGSVFSSYDQMQGEPLGFVFAAVATVAGAINVVLVYGMLQAEDSMHTPLDLMIYFSMPVVVLLLLPFCIIELPVILRSDDDFPFFYTLLLVATESILSFFMTWAAFTLIGMTSAITFEVLGSVQQVFVFLAALAFFRERLTLANIIGNSIILAGIALYALVRTGTTASAMTYLKQKLARTEESQQQQQQQQHKFRDSLDESWSGL